MKAKENQRARFALFSALAALPLVAALALMSCSSPVDVELGDCEEILLPAASFMVELPPFPAGFAGGAGLPASVGTAAATGPVGASGPGCTAFPARILVSSDFGVSRELYLDWGELARLEFQKNRPAAVLAYIPTASRPYGAIYPYTTVLDDRDGFVAEILWELYNEGKDFSEEEKDNVRLFNWHKLLEALREMEDPWLVDSEKIKAAVRSGKFSKSKIKSWVKKPS